MVKYSKLQAIDVKFKSFCVLILCLIQYSFMIMFYVRCLFPFHPFMMKKSNKETIHFCFSISCKIPITSHIFVPLLVHLFDVM